jgi:hypothetical protein
VEINSVAVKEGDIIGLHNGVLATSGQDVPQVVLRLLEIMSAAEHDLITLYAGAEVSEPAAQAMTAEIQRHYPEPRYEVQCVPGGQPYYHYILSVE